MSPIMNPYNFVLLRPMDNQARQTPDFHAAPGGEELWSGSLECWLFPLSPLLIPHPQSSLSIPIQNFTDNDGRVRSRADQRLKAFLEFFHHLDPQQPVIPASSLKGVFRSVAEAVSNSCLSQVAPSYATTKKIKMDKGIKAGFKAKLNATLSKPVNIYSNEQDLQDTYLTPLGLQPCSHIERDPAIPHSGLCPTCRLFGMPGVDEGNPSPGTRPNAFAGKVAFSDARLENHLDQMEQPVLLTELSTPDATSYLYYEEDASTSRLLLRGRKFYYHRPDLYMDSGANTQRALEYLKQFRQDRNWRPAGTVHLDDGLGRKVLVQPFQSVQMPFNPETAGHFVFVVDFHNLNLEEMRLLVYSLTLEANLDTLQPNGWSFGSGVVHKLGYGKPAGLGSVAIIIHSAHRLDYRQRYINNAHEPNAVDPKKITLFGQKYAKAHANDGNLQDLRAILRWPSVGMTLRYPPLNAFGFDKPDGYRLPRPGREPSN